MATDGGENERAWGVLRLERSVTEGNASPLVHGQAAELTLVGSAPVLVGRSNESACRLSKALLWVSNKHFTLAREAVSGRAELVDTSSNGTWLNGQRLAKGRPCALQPGDRILLSGDGNGSVSHEELEFTFSEAPAAGAGISASAANASASAVGSGGLSHSGGRQSAKRPRASSEGLSPGTPLSVK